MTSTSGTPAPRVSIIIPCFDAGATLAATLSSALAQEGETPEIILVDDGSTDRRTLEILDDLPEGVRLVRRDRGGPGAARNAGRRAARGRYLVVLDADDRIDPVFVRVTTGVLDARPDIGFVYTDIRMFGERGGIHRQLPYNFHDEIHRNQVTTCAAIRREAWDAAGGYREDMPDGGEDWEFFISLGEAGWHGLLVEQPLFHYRVRGGTLSASTRRRIDAITERIRELHPDLYRPESIARLRREWKGALRADDPEGWPYRMRRLVRRWTTSRGEEASDRGELARELLGSRGRPGRAAADALAPAARTLRHHFERLRTARAPWRMRGDPERKRAAAVSWFRSVASRPVDGAFQIVVTCHDDGAHLPDLLLSLAAQRRDDFHLTIVDNASTDRRTLELLAELGAAAGPGGETLRLDENRGPAVARNHGLARSATPFAACIDADDVVGARFLEATGRVLEGDAEVGYAYFDYRMFGAVEDPVRAPDFDLARLLQDNFVVACAPFRREAWRAAGGYCEGMRGGFEDWEFWVGLAARGWMGQRIPETLFYYRRRSGSFGQRAMPDRERWARFIRERHAALYARVESDPDR